MGKKMATGDNLKDTTGPEFIDAIFLDPTTHLSLTARGRKGVINMKTTPKIGKVVGILSVKEDSDMMIITKQQCKVQKEKAED